MKPLLCCFLILMMSVMAGAKTIWIDISGLYILTAIASDNKGVVSVRWKLDGVNLGPLDTTAPYSYVWDTTTTTNGVHTIQARAKDAAGNVGVSTMSVYVKN